jgi:DNA ligase-1
MEKVFEILKQLEMTSSRIDKERILMDNKDNELLKKTFEYALNPYKIYGIGSKTFKAKKINVETDYFKDIFDLLDYLLVNCNGSDKCKAQVNSFLSNYALEEIEWYKRIILKDLRIGVTEKTVNKIWKGLVPVFDVMLAKKYWDYENKIKGAFIITKKLDGIRCVILKENGVVKLVSRQGQLFEDFDEIVAEAEKLPDNFAYDGELLLRNDKGLASKDLYRETMKEVSKDGKKTNVQFNMFDMLPISEFKSGISLKDSYSRKCDLHLLLTYGVPDLEFIIEVQTLYYGTNKEMIIILLNEAIENGDEGVMVNVADRMYECKRTDAILKVKKMQDCDLKIIGFEEGEGKFNGTLGRMNVEYKNNIVGVGSGFSDEMRNEIWNNQEKYLGKIAKIQYFEESKNDKTQLPSLRFPVFLEIRTDKTEPSYN